MSSGPDLGMFLLSHRALRRDLARVEDAVRDLDPASTAEAAPLRSALSVVERMLVLHHRAEDLLVWPLLADRRPDLAPAIDALEAEHVVIDRWLEAVSASLALLARHDPGVRRDALHAGAVDAAATLRSLLDAHLDLEEAVALPAIAASVTDEEWDRVDARRRAALTADEAGISLAWVLSAADDPASLAARLPVPAAEAWRSRWAPELDRRLAPLAVAARRPALAVAA